MGGEQAAETMAIVTEAAAARRGKPIEKEKIDAMKAQIIGVFDGQMDVFSTSARVLDDGVIDPRDTSGCAERGAGDLPGGRGAQAAAHAVLGRAAMNGQVKRTPFSQDPDRQSRRDRVADHAHRAPPRLWRGRGVFRRRRGRIACARSGQGRAYRRGIAVAVLSQHRGDHRGGKGQRRRRRASRLRLPRRECGVRASVPRCRAGVHRPVAGSHQGDGQQGRRQGDHAGSRRALRSRLSGRGPERQRHAGRGRQDRLSRDDQGRRRRWRARHAAGHGRRGVSRCLAQRALRGAKRVRRCQRDPGARDCRSAPHRNPGVRRPPSAMPSISASATARCSGGIRN